MRSTLFIDDDPEQVRLRLRSTPSGPWSVFETFAVDGSLAIGITSTPISSGAAMVVYEGLIRDVAEQAAASLHRWHMRSATS